MLRFPKMILLLGLVGVFLTETFAKKKKLCSQLKRVCGSYSEIEETCRETCSGRPKNCQGSWLPWCVIYAGFPDIYGIVPDDNGRELQWVGL